MKKIITKPDGTIETVEGTAQEIAEYEKQLKRENQNESPAPKVPGLLTDEVKRLMEKLGTGLPRVMLEIPRHSDFCQLIVAQRGWWSITPPRCTCGADSTLVPPDYRFKITTKVGIGDDPEDWITYGASTPGCGGGNLS